MHAHYISLLVHLHLFFFFFFNDTATTEIYTLSLHDALPICPRRLQDRKTYVACVVPAFEVGRKAGLGIALTKNDLTGRSEEHTSELQSQSNLVCRLLLEKKKKDK